MIKAPLSISNSNGYGVHNGVAVEDRTGLVCAVAIGDVPELDATAMARLIVAAPKLKDALAAMLDFWGGYECPEVDAAIAVMQELGEDRWSMQAQMEAEAAS